MIRKDNQVMMIKYYLKQIKRIDGIVTAKIEQLEDLRARATDTGSHLSPDKVGSSGGGVGDKIGGLVAKIIDLEAEINQTIDKLVDTKREVMRAIDSVTDGNLRLLLTLRYLNFKSWEQIAVTMDYSYRNVLYLHGKALAALDKVIVESESF